MGCAIFVTGFSIFAEKSQSGVTENSVIELKKGFVEKFEDKENSTVCWVVYDGSAAPYPVSISCVKK